MRRILQPLIVGVSLLGIMGASATAPAYATSVGEPDAARASGAAVVRSLGAADPVQVTAVQGWALLDTGVAEVSYEYSCPRGLAPLHVLALRQNRLALPSYGIGSHALTCDGSQHSLLWTVMGFSSEDAFHVGDADYEVSTITESCPAQGEPEPCTTHYSTQAGTVGLRPTRRLRQRRPPAVPPTIGVTRLIHKARVSTDAGAVEATVAYTCPPESPAAFFFVRLQQSLDNDPLTSVDAGGPVTCDGTWRRATASTNGKLGRFRAGAAVGAVYFTDDVGDGLGLGSIAKLRLKAFAPSFSVRADAGRGA